MCVTDADTPAHTRCCTAGPSCRPRWSWEPAFPRAFSTVTVLSASHGRQRSARGAVGLSDSRAAHTATRGNGRGDGMGVSERSHRRPMLTTSFVSSSSAPQHLHTFRLAPSFSEAAAASPPPGQVMPIFFSRYNSIASNRRHKEGGRGRRGLQRESESHMSALLSLKGRVSGCCPHASTVFQASLLSPRRAPPPSLAAPFRMCCAGYYFPSNDSEKKL